MPEGIPGHAQAYKQMMILTAVIDKTVKRPVMQ